MIVPSFTAAAAITASTDLVTTLPRSLFVSHGARWALTTARGPIPKHHVAVTLCWHDRTHTDPATIAFRTLVANVLR